MNVTSVVVTHDMNSAFAVADRMAMINEGRIIATGTVEEFKKIENYCSTIYSWMEDATGGSAEEEG